MPFDITIVGAAPAAFSISIDTVVSTTPVGVPANGLPRFWGPMYPDVWGAKPFWSRQYPDRYAASGTIFAPAPAGVGTFALVLESGTTVKYTWQTAVNKSASGVEKRASLQPLPAQVYEGQVLFLEADTLKNRSRVQKYAALGRPFTVGLPYEEFILTANASGTSVFVDATRLTYCDWKNPGQRVIVQSSDDQFVEAVIQSVTGGTIVLDVAPGAIGAKGARIMPSMSVYLDPQVSFSRYPNPDTVEYWKVTATAINFDFAASEGAYATLSLAPPKTASGAFETAFIRARTVGLAGNDISVKFSNTALTGPGEISVVGNQVHVKFMSGITTMVQMDYLINGIAQDKIYMTGTWADSSPIQSGDDEFDYSFLDGGQDPVSTFGAGATLTSYRSSPVWDRMLVLDSSAEDSMQAMNEINSFDGIPFNVSHAPVPDWGRQILYRRSSTSEWQWLKKMLYTIRGRWKNFWLPTWRRDLLYVSSAPGQIVIQGPSEATGDFFGWYPDTRRDIQIFQTAGVTYARVNSAVDNGNGTLTLQIVDELGSPITLSGAVTFISWLELCRLESDEISVLWESSRFTMQTIARVVR